MTERDAFLRALVLALTEGLTDDDRRRAIALLQETPCDES